MIEFRINFKAISAKVVFNRTKFTPNDIDMSLTNRNMYPHMTYT